MSTISNKPFAPTSYPPPSYMPFVDGERMTVDEFIRRWEALPASWRGEHKHVELIEGVVRMSPPISLEFHSEPHLDLLGLLSAYRWATPGILGGGPGSIILGVKNMPEPDGMLAIDPKCGGRIKLDEKGYVHGASELVAEIAASSVADDLGIKKELYAKFGVEEYVVWRTKEKMIDWFKLAKGSLEPMPLADGVYQSEAFPGLWLAAGAMVAGNFAEVQRVLEQGLASPEHRTFVEQLAKNKSA